MSTLIFLILFLQPATFHVRVFDDCGKAKNDLYAHTPDELPKYIDGIRVIDLCEADTNCYENVEPNVIPETLRNPNFKEMPNWDNILITNDTICFRRKIKCPERAKPPLG